MKNQQPIVITIEEKDRIFAINKLASAVEALAFALNKTSQVVVQGCTFTNTKTGITIKRIKK